MTSTATPRPGQAPSRIGICHATGSENAPYVYLEVSERSVDAHREHGDRIGVASAAECPGVRR
jgi:hypothetical protein